MSIDLNKKYTVLNSYLFGQISSVTLVKRKRHESTMFAYMTYGGHLSKTFERTAGADQGK